MRDELHVCDDADALARHARDWLVQRVAEQRAARPFRLALSGGSTPAKLYRLLADLPPTDLDWSQVLLLWGDERNVPREDPQSNYRMVRETLLDHIKIPPENVLGVPDPGGDAVAAAEAYAGLLQERLGPTVEESFPEIDCVLLGLGEDVHTASLFPGTSGLSEKRQWVVANHVPQLDCWRFTLTAPLINAARNVAFLLSGRSKCDALGKLWHATLDPNLYPAQLIRPSPGKLWYLLDKEALGQTQLPEAVRTEIVTG